MNNVPDLVDNLFNSAIKVWHLLMWLATWDKARFGIFGVALIMSAMLVNTMDPTAITKWFIGVAIPVTFLYFTHNKWRLW